MVILTGWIWQMIVFLKPFKSIMKQMNRSKFIICISGMGRVNELRISYTESDDIRSNIPIIVMTANEMKTEVDRCFEAGMNAYIIKPFDRNELLLNKKKLLNCQFQKI